jgi:hypothetical protein
MGLILVYVCIHGCNKVHVYITTKTMVVVKVQFKMHVIETALPATI